jgi:uncharacterized membrane protein YfcA
MTLTLAATLLGIGGIGGFFAGMLGFGGGVLMFPMLYYLPPLMGVDRFDAKNVAAIVATQVVFSSLTAGVIHWRGGAVHGRLVLTAGSVSAASALVSGIASKWVSERFLLLLLGIVTIMTALIMLLPSSTRAANPPTLESLNLPQLPLVAYSLGIGLVIGFLGAGNFIFVPVLIYMLSVPTRTAIGSSLFIAMMNSSSGFLGKLLTGQIPFASTVLAVAGAMLGAFMGESVHRRLSTRALRRIYATLVVFIALRVWLTILGFDR